MEIGGAAHGAEPNVGKAGVTCACGHLFGGRRNSGARQTDFLACVRRLIPMHACGTCIYTPPDEGGVQINGLSGYLELGLGEFAQLSLSINKEKNFHSIIATILSTRLIGNNCQQPLFAVFGAFTLLSLH